MKAKGYSNYEVYPEEGKIWSYLSNCFIGHKDHKRGYWYCTLLTDDGKRTNWYLHRFIWYSVNGEIPDGYQVNHIDENVENNSIFNLNIMTPKENSNWGTRTERIKAKTTNGKCSRNIIASQNNKIIHIFPSMMEAERNGYNASNVCKCCKGKLTHYKNYKWQYVDYYLADWWEEEMEKATF